MTRPARLRRDFFARSVHEVAPDLIGATLMVDGVGGTIVEVEAYHHTDPAAHSYGGRTERNAVMFGPPGYAYVYRSYGIHWCVNFVCEAEGSASAVLIRALAPTAGLADDAAPPRRRRRAAAVLRAGAAVRRRSASRLPTTRCRSIAPPFELRARTEDAGDRRRPAHRHHQGGRQAVALRPCRLALPEQAVPELTRCPTCGVSGTRSRIGARTISLPARHAGMRHLLAPQREKAHADRLVHT